MDVDPVLWGGKKNFNSTHVFGFRKAQNKFTLKSPKKCICLHKNGKPMKDNGQNGCQRRWIHKNPNTTKTMDENVGKK